MKIIATISDMARLAMIVDARTGAKSAIPGQRRFIDRSVKRDIPIRPFGITWTSDELFIANHQQLLVFGRDFRFKRIEGTPLQNNTHQLAHHADRVWAVSTLTNSLVGVMPGSSVPSAVEFDLVRHAFRTYDPMPAKPNDTHHFNSLLWTGDKLFVSAHNLREPSFINSYDARTMSFLETRENAGFAVHGLALDGEEMMWISTDTWEIRSSDGYALKLPRDGYSRGFAVTKDYFVVATSQRMARDERVGGDSWIDIFDRRRRKRVAEIFLQDTGSINDLRILDEFDFAHQVAPFFPA